MSRIVHFEIPADDPERAIGFYEAIFGWKIDKWDGPQEYWLITTGEDNEPGINGGLVNRMHPEHRVCNTVDVPSVDEFTQKIEAAGGKVVAPRMAVAGVGYLAYVQDTEGNVFGMMETDESAQAE